MSQTMIDREPTKEEKADFINLRDQKINVDRLFKKKLDEKATEWGKKFVAFDWMCARDDFKDDLERQKRESFRRHGQIKPEEIKIDWGNLDRYAGIKDLVFVAEHEVREEKLIDSMRSTVTTGYDVCYKCKRRNHNIAVFVPIDVYNERKKKKENKKESKEKDK